MQRRQFLKSVAVTAIASSLPISVMAADSLIEPEITTTSMSTTTDGPTTTTTTDDLASLDNWAPGYFYLGLRNRLASNFLAKPTSPDFPRTMNEAHQRVLRQFTDHIYKRHFQALSQLKLRIPHDTWYGLGKELWRAINREDGAGLLMDPKHLINADPQTTQQIRELQQQLADHPTMRARLGSNNEIYIAVPLDLG